MARDLRDLGFFCIEDLKGQDPERMFKRLRLTHGANIDRSVLYVFRCAVYFATEATHDPELLKWWNWSDEARQPD